MRASSRAGTSRLCRNAQTYRACQGAAAVEEEDIVDGADSEEEASHLGEEATVVDTVDGVGASRHTRRRCLEIRRGELLWSTNCRHHFQYRDVFRCKIRVREGQRRHRLYFSARRPGIQENRESGSAPDAGLKKGTARGTVLLTWPNGLAQRFLSCRVLLSPCHPRTDDIPSSV